MFHGARQGPVTPAEFQLLLVLWDLGVGSVAAIHAGLPRTRKVAYNTVLTQVRLLHEKGYVLREAVGRSHVYRPRWSREEVLRRIVDEFLKHYFEGSAEGCARFLGRDSPTDQR